MRTFLIAATVVVAGLANTSLASAADPAKCSTALGNATVQEVYKYPPPASGEPSDVALGDKIALKISGLDDVRQNCPDDKVVLFLNGYSITGLTHGPGIEPGKDKEGKDTNKDLLLFTLRIPEDTRAATAQTPSPSAAWMPILGSPSTAPRNVVASIGLEGQSPIGVNDRSKATLHLTTIGNRWFAIWAGIFVLLAIAFIGLALCSDILRDGTSAAIAAGIRPAYSLSKTQGAVWLFVILAAYLLIGLVTGDFANSINSTALILLGIGAGTVVGSAVIDATKQDQATADTVSKISAARTKLDGINQDIKVIDDQLKQPRLTDDEKKKLDANRTAQVDTQAEMRTELGSISQRLNDIDVELAKTGPTLDEKKKLEDEQKDKRAAQTDTLAKIEAITQQIKVIDDSLAKSGLRDDQKNDLETKKKAALSDRAMTQLALARLTGGNENFLVDILSDANGVSFHRFQMAAWTLVLAIVFAKGVYVNLAMPVFDTTLMGLLGLSAATYLGLKIPEATTPKTTQ